MRNMIRKLAYYQKYVFCGPDKGAFYAFAYVIHVCVCARVCVCACVYIYVYV
jgi:hypothetical protein